MKINKETIKLFNEMGYNLYFLYNGEYYNTKNILAHIDTLSPIVEYIEIFNTNTEGYGSHYTDIKVPKKKEITIEWLMNYMEKKDAFNSTYINLSKIIKEKIEGINAYPTSYGVGVWIIGGYKVKETIQQLEELFDSMGVIYKNEHSDARLVYRFKISKSKDNLKIFGS